MATTQHLVRMLALVPAARQNAVNTWIHNNLDPTGGDWLDGTGYSATGNAPATHYVFNAALTIPEFRAIGVQLLQMSGLSLPADWDAKTREEKFAWFRARVPTIRTQTGIRLRVFANDGTWDNPQDELAAAGLLPITPDLVTAQAVTAETNALLNAAMEKRTQETQPTTRNEWIMWAVLALLVLLAIVLTYFTARYAGLVP